MSRITQSQYEIRSISPNKLFDKFLYNKEYYYFTRGMVEKMDRKYFVSLPLPFRILLKLPNYYIALIYVKLASMFKKQ